MMTLDEAQAVCAALSVRRIDLDHVQTLYDTSDPKIEPGGFKILRELAGRPTKACPVFMLLVEHTTRQEAIALLLNWHKMDYADDPVARALNLDPHYLAGFMAVIADHRDPVLRGTALVSTIPSFAAMAYALHLVGQADGRAFLDRFLGGRPS